MPSLWWWSLDLIATCALVASIWFAGGAQTARALVCFSLALLIGAFALTVRVGLALDRPSRWLHVAVVPALFVAAVLAREPLIRWTFEYRFSRARPVLTEAAKAYLADRNAPAPAHAGSFKIVDRRIAGSGVVFYAEGMGPLLLKRCGLAYLPDGSDRFEHIDDEWYLYCL